MSESSSESKVAAKFEELAEAVGADIEDVTLEVQQDFGTKRISGADVVEYLSEGEDEQSPEETEADPEGVEEQEDTTEGGDEVDIHFEEMDYKDLQKLASEQLASYPSDQSKTGLVKALSEAELEVNDTEGVEDTTEGGEEEENDLPSKKELMEAGVKEQNVEDVLKYRSKNGKCQTENCPYGANSSSNYCASHQGSKEKSKTSNDSSKKSNADKVGQVKDLFEVSQLEAEAVVFQVSEGNYESYSEAVQNHI
jgi:hypothetical protein